MAPPVARWCPVTLFPKGRVEASLHCAVLYKLLMPDPHGGLYEHFYCTSASVRGRSALGISSSSCALSQGVSQPTEASPPSPLPSPRLLFRVRLSPVHLASLRPGVGTPRGFGRESGASILGLSFSIVLSRQAIASGFSLRMLVDQQDRYSSKQNLPVEKSLPVSGKEVIAHLQGIGSPQVLLSKSKLKTR